jgi:hypothetical protein
MQTRSQESKDACKADVVIIIIILSSHSINAIGPAPLRSGNKSHNYNDGF